MNGKGTWRIGVLTCIVLLSLAQFTAAATTYYVSTGGSDSNSGLSPSSAWATISKGDSDSALVPGDTVIVQAGTYDVSAGGDGPTLALCAGTAAAPITYRASGEVVLSRGTSGGCAFRIVGAANHIMLDGFRITGGGYGLYVAGSGNEVKNCQISDRIGGGNGVAVWFVGASNSSFHNNVVGPNLPQYSHAIVDDNSGGNNKFFNNTIIEPTDWVFVAAGTGTGVEFKNNIVYGGVNGILGANPTMVHSNNILYNLSGITYSSTTPGANEYFDNPGLVDAAGGDYTLAPGSLAIDTGAFAGMTYNGAAPDIGAFESAGTATQVGAVTGTVTDTENSPLAGARVSAAVLGTDYTVMTDSSGYYSMTLPLGDQTITAVKGGYRSETQTVNVRSTGTATQDFSLLREPRTYYVAPSPAGDDTYDGLAPTYDGTHGPWASIDYADKNNRLGPGDTVMLEAGTYDISAGGDGPTLLNCAGTPGFPVMYKANGEVILDRGSSGGCALRIMAPAHDITLDGIHVKGGAIVFYMSAASGIELKNCWISDRVGGGNYPALWLAAGCSGCKVHHTVIGPNLPQYSHAIVDDASGGNNKFFNNTILESTDWVFVSSGSAPGVEFKNNIIYGANNGILGANASMSHSNNMMYNLVGTVYAATTAGPNETTDVDPMFVSTDPFFPDYHLAEGSPAIDAGLFFGQSYNGAAPDLGAFESDGTLVVEVGTVTGKVTDVVTGSAVGQVSVSATVLGQPVTALTDANGEYSIILPSGDQSLTAAKGGYDPQTASATVSANDTVTLNFSLTPVGPKTYYVSQTGSDSNNGLTPDTAWATIDKGDRDNKLGPGDTVIVMAGTYDMSGAERALAVTSGTEENPITYQAQGTVVLDRGANAGSVLRIVAPAHHIVMDGFHFSGGSIIFYMNGTSGNELKNCWLSDKTGGGNSPALWMVACSDTSVHNNVIGPNLPAYTHGICDDGSLGNNKFFNNTIIGTTDWVFVSAGSATGVEFKNNIAHNIANGIFGANATMVHSNNILSAATGTLYLLTDAGAGEMTDNPSFVDFEGADYHLAAGSPAIDAGTDVGLPFNGSAPDIGAFETAGFMTEKIGEVRGLADGVGVVLTGSVVTAASGVFSGSAIYVEDESRAAGVRVAAPATPLVSEGDRVTVQGAMATVGGERVIQASAILVGTSGDPLEALGISGKGVCGPGLDNAGVLATIWGRVTFVAADSSYFCIDDGSERSDGLGHTGIPVVVSDTLGGIGTLPAVDSYVSVTGLVGANDFAGGTVAVVRPRRPADVR